MTNRDNLKSPSFSLEAERTVLGGIMLDGSQFEMIRERLSPEDFYFYYHKGIYELMDKISKKNIQITPSILTIEGKYDGVMELELYKMANHCTSTNNLRAYADIVREKSVQRQLLAVGNEIIEERKDCNKVKWSNFSSTIEEHVERLHNRLAVKPISPYEQTKERLAMFLEEAAYEIRISDIDIGYLEVLSLELNRALTCTFFELEDLDDQYATN